MATTRNLQRVVPRQPDTEDSMSVSYLRNDDDSIPDNLSMDTYDHKVNLKKTRDRFLSLSLIELTNGRKGSELMNIQNRFQSAIFNYIEKKSYALQMAQDVEMHVQAFMEVEALVRGLEFKTVIQEFYIDKDLECVVNEVQHFRSMLSGR
ncbi:hypothetical protein PISL3812_00993 [Talaromyces islandicus]|uniref:Uncharacterized protein n=1 Tax=Talaromyces islandicus TaxID=28573 RepID=A0A0U1LKT3_TALIS|nr:hypothetical protein PISL3812_00993 [Talaromyces islandicus]